MKIVSMKKRYKMKGTRNETGERRDVGTYLGRYKFYRLTDVQTTTMSVKV